MPRIKIYTILRIQIEKISYDIAEYNFVILFVYIFKEYTQALMKSVLKKIQFIMKYYNFFS